jgi:hypothetical protein
MGGGIELGLPPLTSEKYKKMIFRESELKPHAYQDMQET